MKPRILILHANGSNRDRDVAWACELAGGEPEIVHINQLTAGERHLRDYQMLVIPGGFSYGDDLGAGKLLAVALRHQLAADLAAFVEAGRPVLGICNGFQVLVKSGLLPGYDGITGDSQQVTLTRNDSAHFECRWVYLQPQVNSRSVFTVELVEPIYCPVAHGEGKFVARDSETLAVIQREGLVALRYTDPDGGSASYPWNPNGSQSAIAGICNPAGNILGLMPHPENHIIPQQHPQFRADEPEPRQFLGLPLFQNGIRYAAS